MFANVLPVVRAYCLSSQCEGKGDEINVVTREVLVC